MTSPVEKIEITCPGWCKTYTDWQRPSFNLEETEAKIQALLEGRELRCF